MSRPCGRRNGHSQNRILGLKNYQNRRSKPTAGCKKNVAGAAAEALLKAHPQKAGFEIEIYKNIKAGSGIGSSAASAAGAVFGINELLGKPFTAHQLIAFAMQGEALASGSAHADNVAPVLMGGITLVRSIDPIDVIQLPTPKELTAVILHPKIELKTMHAREIIKKNVTMEKAIQQWGNLGAFVSALFNEDYGLMSRSLKDEIIEPMRSLLIPEFDSLKKASIECRCIRFWNLGIRSISLCPDQRNGNCPKSF